MDLYFLMIRSLTSIRSIKEDNKREYWGGRGYFLIDLRILGGIVNFSSVAGGFEFNLGLICTSLFFSF